MLADPWINNLRRYQLSSLIKTRPKYIAVRILDLTTAQERLQNYNSLICAQNLCLSIGLVRSKKSEALYGVWSSFLITENVLRGLFGTIQPMIGII